MKAHFQKIDLENIKALYEVRIFKHDEDAIDCMKQEKRYQGVKLVRIDKDNNAWVSLTHGLWGKLIFEQVADFLQDECGVDLIERSHRGRIHKLTSGEK